ncbi:hypothetical protein H310_05209 [Aphanomyces invadans]|uniref:Uncharacterized protein n=1 Tax=Aphanomyces invadans TaxID=157072 RepID=A0A024UC70_9STRA|nr:hypothetical protein H310_05209 [Aphanomyces invadans]ETW03859.1 hypothetical protein H310_05209 [Aphanomyces invadans]|eukprot:XP_008868088.1 hypothetical protein H310_05209 [Aphanomyces invadans]
MKTQVVVPILVAVCSSIMYMVAVTPSGDAWNANWVAVAEAANTNVTWMQEGTQEAYRFRQFKENKTFCFSPSSSLPFRVDSLNDPRQPYLVQYVARFEQFNAWLDQVDPYVTPAKQFLGSMQPLMWGWSNLRVAITSDSASSLTYTYTTPPSRVCHILEHVQGSAYPSIRNVLPDMALYVLSKAAAFTKRYCEGCSRGCPVACEDTNNSGMCMATFSPHQYPCVTVHGLETGYMTSQAHVAFTTVFYSVISLQYVQNLAWGYLLYFFSAKLAQSRAFHYVLGAAIGIVCSIALLLYQLYKQSQSTIRLLPGAGLVQSASLLTTIAFPVTGFMMLPAVYSLLQWAMGLLFTFWASDDVFGVPHLGKFYFLLFGLVGMAFVWWFQWWAPPTTSADSTVDSGNDDEDVAVVLADLRRMEAEDLLLPDNQQRLARALQLFSIMLLFQSTSSVVLSWVIVTVALLWSVLEALFGHVYYWYWSEMPGLHSTLISTDEYATQGKTETEKALAALRQHLKENPHVAETVREDHEVRLRRFMHGRDHMEASMGKAPKDSQPSKSHWRCCIQ